MTTQVRHPIWFFAVRPAGARTFATLYGLESFARASISSVIPIQAYEILHSKQGVSILYTVVALLGLSAGQAIEWPFPDGPRRLRVDEVLSQPLRHEAS